jgi:hypothetical protein
MNAPIIIHIVNKSTGRTWCGRSQRTCRDCTHRQELERRIREQVKALEFQPNKTGTVTIDEANRRIHEVLEMHSSSRAKRSRSRKIAENKV